MANKDFPDYDLRFYVEDWCSRPWVYKQGFLQYVRDPNNFTNPHPDVTQKQALFDKGWNDADFYARVGGGYFDW